ncbi:Hypothetical protein CpCap5W_0026 [Corynebacterium pseudotuberculosis]|nr:Hypothetical protein CpATCC19410_0031 [Corynebacterium pseudotuberculosis]AZN18916.1 hypothetical protein CpCap1W_0026 [Corynebacterium pseudotuberculosis]AZN21019.1 Hypothetical protein CpOviAF1_0025 [Corynebacterium pseudotuberculosis]QBB90050.1 hypothetical protein CpCR07_0026 [Corynebacterium pseudotuberculosis]QBB92162.1 hypothetical protein CpCAPNAT1_00025 [Corynebacterium pseudotuberculosis]
MRLCIYGNVDDDFSLHGRLGNAISGSTLRSQIFERFQRTRVILANCRSALYLHCPANYRKLQLLAIAGRTSHECAFPTVRFVLELPAIKKRKDSHRTISLDDSGDYRRLSES